MAWSSTWYVNHAAIGHNQGTSWSDAYTDLQSVLRSDQLESGDTILVAEGTYYPSMGDRSIPFLIDKELFLFGGFAPDKSIRKVAQRDPKQYPTILSGDLNRDGYMDDFNALTVVEIYTDALIDGFQIQHGFGDINESSAKGRGGGIYAEDCQATISQCDFRFNYAVSGGGIYMRRGQFYVRNCTFDQNKSSNAGNALCISSEAVISIDHCRFYDNDFHISRNPSTIYFYACTAILDNCRFEGSHKSNFYLSNATVYISNSTATSLNFNADLIDRGNNRLIPNQTISFVDSLVLNSELSSSNAFGVEHGLPSGRVLSHFNHKGQLWFVVLQNTDLVYSSDKKLLIVGRYNGYEVKVHRIPLFTQQNSLIEVLEFFPTQNQKILIRTTTNANILYDPILQQHELLDLAEYDKQKCVSDLEESEGSDRWIRTRDTIFYTAPKNKAIQSILDSLSFRRIRHIDDSTIIAAAYFDGWFSIDRKTQTVRSPLQQDAGLKGIYPSYAILDSKEKNTFWSDRGSVLSLVRLPGVILKNYPLPLSKDRIYAHTKSGDSLFLANRKKVQIFNLLDSTYMGPIPINGHIINSISVVGSQLFAFTDKGINQVDLSTNSSSKYDTNRTYLSAVIDGHSMWCGTGDGYLIQYDISSFPIKKISENFIEQFIFSLAFDGQSRLWMGTGNGIWCKSSDGIKKYNQIPSSELSSSEANRHSIYYDSLFNVMYVGTVNGLNIIRLDDLEGQHSFHIYEDHLSYFVEDSLQYFFDHEARSNVIKLSAQQRYFGATCYADFDLDATAMTYQYRLNNGPWIDNGQNRSVTFSDMHSGKYSLEIQAIDAAGFTSDNTLKYQIAVDRMFYYKWWFIGSVLLFLGAIAYSWYRRIKNENLRLETIVAARTSELKKDKETIEKQAEKLLNLDQLKNRFFANISHELRTPLTLIKGPLKQSKIKSKNNLEVDAHLNLALNNVVTLENRIEELLDLSKLENGTLKLKNKRVELVQFLKIISSNFHSLFIEKEIKYEFANKLSEQWWTDLDKSKVEKIIFNLIHNAIKFTPRGGEIKLELKAEKDLIRIDFSDTGKGIPASDIAYIFDRYFQTNEPESRPEGGTGIGLSLVKELIELMGGSIRVKSKEGAGTIFTLLFPFVETGGEVGQSGSEEQSAVVSQRSAVDGDQSAVGSQEQSAVVSQQSGGAVSSQEEQSTVFSQQSAVVSDQSAVGSQEQSALSHILIVEDHTDLRAHIASLVSSLYVVSEAENGAVAWHKIKSGELTPDLIISDVMMPEMDGFEFLSKVRHDPKFSTLPFIFLTAKSGVESRIKALRIGVDDYMQKPFDEEELYARIENLLKNAAYRSSFENEIKKEESDQNKNYETVTAVNEQLLELQLFAIQNLDHPQFSIDFLAEKMKMPRRSFYRFIQSETGLNPNAYIKELKLLEARSLLEQNAVSSISELSLQMGFQKPKYFSKIFKERFGKVPSEYLS